LPSIWKARSSPRAKVQAQLHQGAKANTIASANVGHIMYRRDFLKTAGTLVASGAISNGVLAEALGSENTTANGGRLVLPMNRNWRYRSEVQARVEGREFDDAGVEKVVIPHTTKRLPLHSFDENAYACF